MLPRVLDLPEVADGAVDWPLTATVIALVMQGIIWTNIIVGHFVQRYINFHTTDGSSITTFKAIGVLVRLVIWIILGRRRSYGRSVFRSGRCSPDLVSADSRSLSLSRQRWPISLPRSPSL